MKTKIMKASWLLTFWLALAFGALAQNKTIEGRVLTDTGEALIGVSVVIKGTTTGVITDIDGNFNLQVAPEDVINVSFIGFDTQEFVVGSQSSFNIIMKESFISLNEVVAIGYGTAKRSDLTSAISTVQGEEIKSMSVGNPVTALQGKTPGVQVIGGSGHPGASPKVMIRGFTSLNLDTDPLYVVDGVPMGNNLNFLNPNEIESMDILKDASAAAIYGSRASNGVVLITTKRGAEGTTNFSVDFSYGLQVFNKPFDMADGTEYGDIMNQSRQNAGLNAPFDDTAALGKRTD